MCKKLCLADGDICGARIQEQRDRAVLCPTATSLPGRRDTCTMLNFPLALAPTLRERSHIFAPIAERARGARDLRARRAPPLGQRVLAHWRSWARVIRGRLPFIGRPNAEILHHGPPPAYARRQAAVGGAEPWPRAHPGIRCVAAWGALRGGPVSERRAAAAGWQVALTAAKFARLWILDWTLLW